MMLLYQGDRLPVVATLQKLVGAGCDGAFGPNTRSKVVSFQTKHGLAPDGVVGRLTWMKLMQVSGLVTVDVIDVTDGYSQDVEGADVMKAGATPIMLQGMSNGVGVMVDLVKTQVGGHGKLALLRIHAHGRAGKMNVSGTGSDPADIASIADVNLGFTGGELRRLDGVFARFGSIQLLGCCVGAGVEGQAMLKGVAEATGVPATGGVKLQYAGGGKTWRYEGPTRTGFPWPTTLAGWAREATH
jgi:Putative peptidoglycan binding domain/Domain of unknown function (DUF4347)